MSTSSGTAFPGVPPALSQALTTKGYAALTSVQEAMLDPSLAGADLLVSARTGSGKTVAFGLALAGTLLEADQSAPRAGDPLALVIAPTRELALQVQRELAWLYAPAGLSVVACVGGMDIRQERRALSQGAHIVVGTPGRLVDHLTREALFLDGLKAVVLDEADEMLDMGFRDELEQLLSASPADRRTLLFSATVPAAISQLAARYQRAARRIDMAAPDTPHGDIAYVGHMVVPRDAENAIINVLRLREAKTAMVFCATRMMVTHLSARLHNRGFAVVALSGELSQKERSSALQALRDGRARVCVATDVAARGIDLPELSLVIHADLPKTTEALLHRSGRTGRAGRKGTSVLIVPKPARRRIERVCAEAGVDLAWSPAPSAAEVERADEVRLLAHPALTTPIEAHELAALEPLLAQFEPGQLAAAFLRLARGGLSAPEDIAEVGEEPRPVRGERGERPERAERGERAAARPRSDFANSVWVSVSVGRAQRAEPRWILPLICRAAELDRSDIGAIKIGQTHSHVELLPEAAERLFAAVGPSGRLEKGVMLRPADGPVPDGPRPPRGGWDPGTADRPPTPRPEREPSRAVEEPTPRPQPARREVKVFEQRRSEPQGSERQRPRPPRPEGQRTEGQWADARGPEPQRPGKPRPPWSGPKRDGAHAKTAAHKPRGPAAPVRPKTAKPKPKRPR